MQKPVVQNMVFITENKLNIPMWRNGEMNGCIINIIEQVE